MVKNMALTPFSEEDVKKINKKKGMKKKFLRGKKEDVSEWMRRIAYFILTIEKETKSDKYIKERQKLFLEYRIEGMESNEACRKAKLVLDCFEICC